MKNLMVVQLIAFCCAQPFKQIAELTGPYGSFYESMHPLWVSFVSSPIDLVHLLKMNCGNALWLHDFRSELGLLPSQDIDLGVITTC